MLDRKIVYLPHPVSEEVKRRHLAAGERIIDVRFAPKDYVAAPAVAETIAKPENDVKEAPVVKRRGRRPKNAQ